MKNRKSGYYWIQMYEEDNDWEVAFYEGSDNLPEDNIGWYSIWDGGTYKDNEIFKINENEIKR